MVDSLVTDTAKVVTATVAIASNNNVNNIIAILKLLTSEQAITMLGLILGSNGLGFAMYKGISKAYDKWRAKRGLKSNALDVMCAERHQQLLDSVGKLVGESVETVTRLEGQFTQVREDIKDLVKQRTFEDGIKNKRDIIMNQGATLIDQKGVHDFLIHKCERFTTFILDNYKTIWDSPFEVFEERIKSLAEAVRTEGAAITGNGFVEYFYTNHHTKSTKRYMDDIREIFDDIANNRATRFVDQSLIFMQRFSSEVVRAYITWTQLTISQEFNELLQQREADNAIS